MTSLEAISQHSFFKEVLADGRHVFEKRDINPIAVEIEPDPEFDEYEYYVHAVGFTIAHFITWCKQLDYGIEFISNFRYREGIKITRIDHLIYNVENYIIRLQSIYDRILQIVNKVFHLGIDESQVSHSSIVSNIKVSRTNVPQKLKPLYKFIKRFSEERNTIIHRHSYIDLKLRKLELFYMAELGISPEDENLAYLRSRFLKETIKEKKEQFKKYNNEVFRLIPPIFDELKLHYSEQKSRFKKVLY
jgi:hypothetical protein